MVSTRPRINFVNGVCSACINFAERKKINWKQREKTLWKLCNKIRKKNGDYDVIVAACAMYEHNTMNNSSFIHCSL